MGLSVVLVGLDRVAGKPLVLATGQTEQTPAPDWAEETSHLGGFGQTWEAFSCRKGQNLAGSGLDGAPFPSIPD